MEKELLSREGHRKRIRYAYIHGDMDSAPSANLLELFLSIVIPRKDVKQISYDLINRFGSLEGVFKANPYELMSVDGVGESTAVALSLVDKFHKQINLEKNKNIKKLSDLDSCFEYCKNLLEENKNELVYLITLTAQLKVIDCYKVGEGDALSCSVDMKSIITYAIKDNAPYVMITHNHPEGSAHPSGEDANFTVRLKDMLETINVKLIDHIIVGKDELVSLKHSIDYQLNI